VGGGEFVEANVKRISRIHQEDLACSLAAEVMAKISGLDLSSSIGVLTAIIRRLTEQVRLNVQGSMNPADWERLLQIRGKALPSNPYATFASGSPNTFN
jgi:hypothetical protein